MNETAQLAKFTSEMEFDKLPPQAVLMAKQCLLDWLFVAVRRTQQQTNPPGNVFPSRIPAGAQF